MKSDVNQYGRAAQRLHWASALLIILMWPMGMIMTRTTNGAVKLTIYKIHIGIGLLVLALTIARVVWRFADDRPKTPPNLTSVQTQTVLIAHTFQYIVLLMLTLSGVGMLIASGGLSLSSISPSAISQTPTRAAHNIAANIFIVLLVMHMGGVARYQLTMGDTLGRMGVNLSTESRALGSLRHVLNELKEMALIALFLAAGLIMNIPRLQSVLMVGVTYLTSFIIILAIFWAITYFQE